MQKFLEKKGGFIAIIVCTFVMLFFYLNKNIGHTPKMEKKEILTDIHSRKGNVKKSIDSTEVYTKIHFPCADITIPTLDKKAGFWQPVNENTTAYVFSAYFIHEYKKVIVIGITRLVRTFLYLCQFWYKGEGNKYVLSYQMHAKIKRLPEGHGLPYSAGLFNCPLNYESDSPPSYVSIVDKNCTSPLNMLIVQHVNKPISVSRTFSLCLPPLFGNLSVHRFVEWIEFNKILGADMLFVYQYTSNPTINKILEFYSNKGVITIIHWNLPQRKNETKDKTQPISVHYFGQVAALNDCLYRNKYESEFIVNVDLDEFIIPRIKNETTWHQMLSQVNEKKVGYVVRNTFFNVRGNSAPMEISNKTEVDKYKLITLHRLQREEKIFSPGVRSKYFARTASVYSVMIHTLSSKHKLQLPVNKALLHHYRDIRPFGHLKGREIFDRTVPTKFGDVLIKNVVSVWSELNKFLTDNVEGS